MKRNIFLFAFEAAFQGELDLSTDDDGRYTDPHTISVFHTYVDQISRTTTEKIAEDICAVQPMPPDVFKNVYEDAKKSEEETPDGFKWVPAFPGAFLLRKLEPIE